MLSCISDNFLCLCVSCRLIFADMKKFHIALAIAGSDSGGGAGIQADIKTFSSLGVYATTAITALTAQNTRGVKTVLDVPSSFLNEQLEAITTDFDISAIKIGMLGSEGNVRATTAFVKKMPTIVPVILDPVMKSTSGSSLLDGASGGDIMELMRSVTLVTPNIPEAEKFTGMTIDDVSTMIAAARILLAMGCRNVLLKGGHLPADHLADVLMMEGQPPVVFESGKVATRNLHGTGCTLSSAITAFLCYDQPLAKAVENAECYVKKAIFASKDVVVGEGNGPLNHFFSPKSMYKSNI